MRPLRCPAGRWTETISDNCLISPRYHVTNPFAVSSRSGTPEDLKVRNILLGWGLNPGLFKNAKMLRGIASILQLLGANITVLISRPKQACGVLIRETLSWCGRGREMCRLGSRLGIKAALVSTGSPPSVPCRRSSSPGPIGAAGRGALPHLVKRGRRPRWTRHGPEGGGQLLPSGKVDRGCRGQTCMDPPLESYPCLCGRVGP